MIFLVDYDNLPGHYKRINYLHLTIIELLGKVDSTDSLPIDSVSFRLYGGWLEGKKMSRKAKELSEQIDQHFPMRTSFLEKKMIVNAELARALVCDPEHDFVNTFRIRSPHSFKIKSFPPHNCTESSNCPISAVHPFVHRGRCIHNNCDITPNDVFYRAEQKMVDSY